MGIIKLNLKSNNQICVVYGYGSLGVTGPPNLIGSGTIRMCGFIGVDMSLSEEVCHCGGGL